MRISDGSSEVCLSDLKMGCPIEGVEAGGGDGGDTVAPIATRLASADAGNGADVFKKCTACHTDTQGGPNGIGPNLWEVVGDKIATGRGGFAFSDALKSVGGTWTFDALDAWFTSPRKFANGTKIGRASWRERVCQYV